MSPQEAFFLGMFVGGILASIVIAVWSLIEAQRRDRLEVIASAQKWDAVNDEHSL